MTTPDLPATFLADLRDVQPPIIAGLLIGGCLAKLSRALRSIGWRGGARRRRVPSEPADGGGFRGVAPPGPAERGGARRRRVPSEPAIAGGTGGRPPGTALAGLGPTQLFPLRLRRPLAMSMGAFEMCLGLALLATVLPVGTHAGTALHAPRAATGARITAVAFFLVAAAALAELRGRRPDLGCGCFGDLSSQPAGWRSLARALLLTGAALISIETPALYLPPWSHGAPLLLGIACAELALIAVLSPEVGEALVRLGYTDPCELRRLPADRTLAALRRSRQWRKHARAITTEMPIDMWRELCWRYVVFPYREGGGHAEVVFAVQLKRRRPAVQAAVLPLPPGWPGGGEASPAAAADWGRREAMQLSTRV